MRLAILVVYMFRPERKGLFRLHLSKIRENTKVSYRIFASVGHLDAETAAEVAAEPDIEAIKLPVGVLPQWAEHSDLLDRLYREARKDDYTHFVTLHTDSFPIRPDWTSDILAQFQSGAAVASIAPRCFSACLFWPRSFRESHDFGLLLPHEVRASDECKRFMADHPDYDPTESGIGFLFGCWTMGQRWYEMRPDRQYIYGGCMFHLIGGSWMESSQARLIGFEALRTSFARPVFLLVKSLLPRRLWLATRDLLADTNARTPDGSAAEKTHELDRLLADPDGFLAACGAVRPAVGAS